MRVRKWLREMVGWVTAASAVFSVFTFIWLFLGKYIRGLFSATLHVTVHSLVWAGVAGVCIVGVMHLAKKRYPWLHHSIYYALAHMTGDKAQSHLQDMGDALGGDDRKMRFISLYTFNTSNHPLARKAEEWVARALHLLFWPVIIVALTHTVQDEASTAGGYALIILVLMLVLAVIGIKLRNLVLWLLVAVWLSYIILSQGGVEAEAQAAVIGYGFVLWAAWQEWQNRISRPIPPEDDQPNAAPEPGPEPTR